MVKPVTVISCNSIINSGDKCALDNLFGILYNTSNYMVRMIINGIEFWSQRNTKDGILLTHEFINILSKEISISKEYFKNRIYYKIVIIGPIPNHNKIGFNNILKENEILCKENIITYIDINNPNLKDISKYFKIDPIKKTANRIKLIQSEYTLNGPPYESTLREEDYNIDIPDRIKENFKRKEKPSEIDVSTPKRIKTENQPDTNSSNISYKNIEKEKISIYDHPEYNKANIINVHSVRIFTDKKKDFLHKYIATIYSKIIKKEINIYTIKAVNIRGEWLSIPSNYIKRINNDIFIGENINSKYDLEIYKYDSGKLFFDYMKTCSFPDYIKISINDEICIVFSKNSNRLSYY